MLTSVVVLYALTAGIAGYVSAALYKIMGGASRVMPGCTGAPLHVMVGPAAGCGSSRPSHNRALTVHPPCLPAPPCCCRHQLGAQRADHHHAVLRPPAGHVLVPQHCECLLLWCPTLCYGSLVPCQCRC